jgi:hypothetical protein
MKKTSTVAVVVALAVGLCFALSASEAQSGTTLTEDVAADWMVNGYKAAPIPVWKITIEGTAYQVCCKDAVNARFCVYDNGTPQDETDDAVLDKETGLWWERSPDDTERTWDSAIKHCYQRKLANRKGCRLPTIEELASLVDDTQPAPTLPAGHPFINVQSDVYWSSTTDAGYTANAWQLHFFNGGVSTAAKSYGNNVWCVRGGPGHDAY